MRTHVSRFHILTAGSRRVVKLGPDDFGLYLGPGSARNDFGTPLAARGTAAQLATLLADLGCVFDYAPA